jgi:CBS domain-containing protein
LSDLASAPVSPRAFLSRHQPFDSFSAEALDRIESALEIRFAASGERILSRGGTPSDALWIVRKGRVRLERDGEALELLEAGDCFGFPSLLGERPPLRDAVATEESLLFRVPKRDFLRLLDEPGAARFFLEGLAHRLRLHTAGAGEESRASHAPVSSFARRPLAVVDPAATVEQAAKRMRELGVGSLLVTREPCDADGALPTAVVLGIVTDRDLRDRIVAAGRDTSTPVGEIATSPLHTLSAGASSPDALLALARHGVRHLPLVEDERIVGLLSASDLVLRGACTRSRSVANSSSARWRSFSPDSPTACAASSRSSPRPESTRSP